MLSACSITSVLKVVVAVSQAIITIVEEFGPPASELANFDAADANRYVSLQNVSLTTTSGDITITISDENTGQVLGEDTFGFDVVNGNTIEFANPYAVNSFVHSYSNYQDGDGFVLVTFSSEFETTLPPEGETGQVDVTTNYDGSPVTSSSGTISHGGGGCTFYCEVQ